MGNASDCVTLLGAFLWENGGPMVDLNTLIPPNSSLLLTNAIDINNHGEIAGMGVPAGCDPVHQDSCEHAYLLIPCDEKHPGECQDYSMIDAPALQIGAPTKELSSTNQQDNETLINRHNQLRNRLMQRYHLSRPTSRTTRLAKSHPKQNQLG